MMDQPLVALLDLKPFEGLMSFANLHLYQRHTQMGDQQVVFATWHLNQGVENCGFNNLSQ